MKKILPILAVYIGTNILFAVIFLLLFHTGVVSEEHVLFYRGLTLLVITSVFVAVIGASVYVMTGKKYLETLIAAIVLAIAVHVSMFIVFPVTFERSVTMFLLRDLNTRQTDACNGMSKEDMQQELIQTYILSGDAVKKRIDEQSAIHMIAGTDACYTVTDRARSFLQFSNTIKTIYNIR